MKKYAVRLSALFTIVCLSLTACATGGTAPHSESGETSFAAAATEAQTTGVTGTTVGETETPDADTTTAPGHTTLPAVIAPTQTTTAPTSTASVPNPTAAETQAPAPTAVPPTGLQKRDQIGFGFYRMGSLADGLLEAIEEEAAKGHINTYLTGMAPYNFNDALIMLHKVKDIGGMTWLGIAETAFLFAQPVKLIDNWKQDLQTMMDTIEEEGLMDSVLGFYFDEPMLCGIKKAEFRDVTGYLRENWPELRVMTVFAVNAISPDVWSTGNDQLLDYDTTQYLTDAGYDMYGTVAGDAINTYRKVNADLKTRLGRDDVRIWYVPCIMSYHGTTDQRYAIEHLKAMYEFLKEEKNPGGLLCYAYDISNRDGIGNIGFRELREQEKNPWTTLENWLLYVGGEIMKMNK